MSIKTKWVGARHLLYTYLTALPRIVWRLTGSILLNPKAAQRFLHHALEGDDLQEDDPVLGSADLVELIPSLGLVDIAIVGPYYSHRSSDTRLLLELAYLAYLARHLNPALIFEIGTFVGRTTRLLALNSPDSCRIVTLDLPQASVAHTVGEAFAGATEAGKIVQLYGDSVTFDFSPWYSKCDFVWVDACHDYEHVAADTKAALRLVRPGGWIAWHDYRHTAWWSGVTRYLRELKRDHPKLRHLRHSTIAVLAVTK